MKNIGKKIIVFALGFGLLLTSILPVSATEPLRDSDNVFEVTMFSAKAGGYFNGNFFKKDNTLYIDEETLFLMAPLEKKMDEAGRTIRLARKDQQNTEFVVTEENCFQFDTVDYYSFVDVMSDLCINVTYDREREHVNVIPVKSVWDMDVQLENMYKNPTYNMSAWQNAAELDADTSRKVSQAFYIGRNLFTLPATAHDYFSGNADYEQYRAALWKIMLPDIDLEPSLLNVFSEEAQYLNVIEMTGDIAKIFNSENGNWGTFCNTMEATGMAASAIGKADKIAQTKDSMMVVEFFYNIENMDNSLVNGVNLVYENGLTDNGELTKVFEDTVSLLSGEEGLWDSLLRETEFGLVETILGEVKSEKVFPSIGDVCVKAMDWAGEKWLGQDYASLQIDSVITATSNLHIQSAAGRSYKYYKEIYDSTENIQKKTGALKNMRDITLVYMNAGHNAWKAMAFDSDLAASSKNSVLEMLQYIGFLLSYDDMDFSVYENALQTKHTIMANYENREQTCYFFKWDAAKGAEVGGLDFVIEGRDENGEGLLRKKIFLDLYYRQNGLLVGRIRSNRQTDKYSRMVETFAMDGVCEVVIRGKNAGSSVADIGIEVAVGTSSNLWEKGLSAYLVTEPDGSVIYRIPLPLSDKVSQGDALPTVRVESKFDFMDEERTQESDNGDSQAIDYVPTGPFNGEYVYDTRKAIYKIRYNDNMFYVYSYSAYSINVAYASQKDVWPADNIGGMTIPTKTFEEEYQHYKSITTENSANRYEKHDVSDYKEIEVDNAVIKYYQRNYIEKRPRKEITQNYFYIEMESGENLSGWWHLGDSEPEGAETFEKFLLELFSNIEIEYK